jgi:hypothetical protein
MPNDKLGSAIKRRSCRETAISRALPNGHSFQGGTEVESPLLQRRGSSEPDFSPLEPRTAGLSALRSSLRCRPSIAFARSRSSRRFWWSRLIFRSKWRCGSRRRVIRCVRYQDRERSNQWRKPKSRKRCSCSI